jgi:hypothetical protein
MGLVHLLLVREVNLIPVQRQEMEAQPLLVLALLHTQVALAVRWPLTTAVEVVQRGLSGLVVLEVLAPLVLLEAVVEAVVEQMV